MLDLSRAVALAGVFLALLAPSSRAAGGGDRIAYLAFTDGYWQVWTVDLRDERPSQVTRSPRDKTRVSWFPEGRSLLVSALDGRVYRANAETGEESPLPLPLHGMTDAVLAPDGKRIAFSLSTADARDDNEIWMVGLDGSGLTKLTNMPWLQHAPSWDPRRPSIYFLSGDGGQSHDVWRISLETRSREQITAGALYHFDLAVSRDGRIAFSSNRSGSYEIYVQELDGSGEEAHQVTEHPALDAGPSWAPDGSAIAFHSLRSGALNLWIKDLESGGLKRITSHSGGARDPAWWSPIREAP